MTETTKIQYQKPLDGIAPYYMRYQGQSHPQDVYMYIDPELKEVWVDYDGEIGGAVSSDIWLGRQFRVLLNPNISTWQVDLLFADESLCACIEEIVTTYDCKWDGNNMRGRHEGDIEGLGAIIAKMLHTSGFDNVWQIDEWLADWSLPADFDGNWESITEDIVSNAACMNTRMEEDFDEIVEYLKEKYEDE